jgi:prevent-host-death family protein
MKTVNIQAAKTHLSRLVEEAAAGEEIVLAKAGKPIAKLVPYTKTRKARVGGFLKGQIWESPDCWAPDEELNKLMTEGPLFPDEPDGAMRVAEEKPHS